MQDYDLLIKAKQEKDKAALIKQEQERQQAAELKEKQEELAATLKAKQEEQAAIMKAKQSFLEELKNRRKSREIRASKKIVFALKNLSQELKSLEEEELEDIEKAAAVDLPCHSNIKHYRKALESYIEEPRDFTQTLTSKAARVMHYELAQLVYKARENTSAQ